MIDSPDDTLSYAEVKAIATGDISTEDAPSIADTKEKRLARRLRQLQSERTTAGRRYNELGPEIEEAQAALVDAMLAAGDLEVTVDGYRGSANPELWAKKIDKATTPQQIAEALAADGLEHLVNPPGYNSNKLSAYLRDLADEHKPIPPHLAGLVEGVEKWRVGFAKIAEGRGRRRVRGSTAPAAFEDGAATG